MPPWVDNTVYDLCARTVMRGGVIYHDVFLHGPPGMILLQTALRFCIGWSSEALRIVDLLIVGLSIALILPAIQRRRRACEARLWTALAMMGFYFSTSEWCHCQIDTWMMPMALAAMLLRGRQTAYLAHSNFSAQPLLLLALLEGLCWGYDFVMKPFVLVPAAACWMVSAVMIWRQQGHRFRWLIFDTLGVFAGACLAVGAVILWLWRSDNLPFFRDASMGTWNQDYYASSPIWLNRVIKLFYWQGNWGVVHLFAIPLALFSIAKAVFIDRRPAPFPKNLGPLLAAVYLGWLLQANFLQRQLIYQMVPPMLLGIAVLASRRWPRLLLAFFRRNRKIRLAFLTFFALLMAAFYVGYFAWAAQAELIHRDLWLVEALHAIFINWYVPFSILAFLIAVVASPRVFNLLFVLSKIRVCRWLVTALFLYWVVIQIPLLNPARLEYWPRCWREGSTPLMRNVLTLESDAAAPDWIALEEVKKFLKTRDVRSRELTCYAVSAIHLYKEMELRPSTRFILLWPALIFFPEHRTQIGWELAMSPQRFAVSDLCQEGFTRDEANQGVRGRPFGLLADPVFQSKTFPWTEPLVFRAGRYLIHRTIPGGRPALGVPNQKVEKNILPAP
jgi:hypothetical protein